MSSLCMKITGSRSWSQDKKLGHTSVTKYMHSQVVHLRLEGNLVNSEFESSLGFHKHTMNPGQYTKATTHMSV